MHAHAMTVIRISAELFVKPSKILQEVSDWLQGLATQDLVPSRGSLTATATTEELP